MPSILESRALAVHNHASHQLLRQPQDVRTRTTPASCEHASGLQDSTNPAN